MNGFNRPLAMSLVGVAVTAVTLLGPDGGAMMAAPVTLVPTAAFAFDDTAYDLRSDGRGAYAHSAKGKDGTGGTIDAEFTLSGAQANVNLNLVKSGRKFWGAYRDTAGTPCATYPCASFTDGWFLTIYGVPGMYNGETKLVQALYTRGGASTVSKYAYPRFTSYWCGPDGGANACPSARQNTGSMMVRVTRSDVGGVATWTAVAAPDPTFVAASDLSELVEQTSSASIAHGLHRSSFKVIVQCLSGCSALPYPPQ